MKSWFKNKWNKGKMLAELKPALFLSLTFCFMIFFMLRWNFTLTTVMNFGMMPTYCSLLFSKISFCFL